MDIAGHIEALRADLTASAGLGDETTIRIAGQLSRALDPALRLRLLDILAEAALEVNGQISHGQIEVRLSGNDIGFAYVETAHEAEPAADDEQAARITLRLPESLKTRAESAAAAEGVSLNTWLVRATARGLDRGARSSGPGRRITGYATS
jgi:HicB-like protein involved in pilus formation